MLAVAGCGEEKQRRSAPPAPEYPPALRDANPRIGVGVAIQTAKLGDAAYRAAAGRLFGSVTPENEMKFPSTEPEPGKFVFTAGDPIVEFAEEHDMVVHGHTLLWHFQLPKWVTGTREQLRRHIRGVVGHYKGRVASWDVVNEGLGETGGLRRTVWLDGGGQGYIARAFHTAREADPAARLVYNDYGTESPDTPKGRALYQLIRGLLADGVPVDAVGFQAHSTLDPIPGFERQLRRVAALGVEVELTEIDVRLPVGDGPPTPAQLAAQARAYERIVGACVAVPQCTNIAFWGLGDGVSWIPEFFPGFGAALLLDEAYKPKPAYTAVRAALLRG